jgi:hypothetical protein
MKGFVEMSTSILPSSSGISINAELRSHDDAIAFVALFNATVAQVFPDPAEADAAEDGEEEDEGATA